MLFCYYKTNQMKPYCIVQQYNVTTIISKVWNQQSIGATYRFCCSRTTRSSIIQHCQQQPPPHESLILLRQRHFGTQRRQRRHPTHSNSNNSNKNQNAEYWDKVYKKSKEQLEQMKGNRKVLNEPKSLNDIISWKVLIVMSISPLILCLLIPELRTPMLNSIQQFTPTNSNSITIDTDSNAGTTSNNDPVQQDSTTNNSSNGSTEVK